MTPVAPHLGLATLLSVSNVWLLQDADGRRFLVDTGHALERPLLRLSLWRAGVRRPGDLAAVILTHRHSDHAGNAAWLRRAFGCPIVCHEDDAPILAGRATGPPLAAGRGPLPFEMLCRIEDRFPAVAPVDETFAEGPWKWGFRIVHVPGHTSGSAMLHHEPTATLFSGDAILSGVPPLRAVEWLRLAVPEFSDDVEKCRASVRKYLEVLPRTDVLCSGHGPGVTRQASEKLRRLLR